MLVRFFAGAAAAAGVDHRTLDLPAGSTAGDLVATLSEGNDHLAAVLRVSALLADGSRVPDLTTELSDVSQLDVLPPFAGG